MNPIIELTVRFRREITGEELEVLRLNYYNGKISIDPDNDLRKAVMQQLRLELQAAYDQQGMNGDFTILDFLEDYINEQSKYNSREAK